MQSQIDTLIEEQDPAVTTEIPEAADRTDLMTEPQDQSNMPKALVRPFQGHVTLCTKVDVLIYFRDNADASNESYVERLEAIHNLSFQNKEKDIIFTAIRNLRSRAKQLRKQKGGKIVEVFPPDDNFNVNLGEPEDEATAGNVPTASASVGRPTKKFVEAAPRTKRAKLATTVAAQSDIPPEEMIIKIVKTSNLSNKLDMQKVFQYCMGTPGKLRYMASKMREKEANKIPTEYTPEEALQLILDLDLTVEQYKKMRQGALRHNSNLYPSYSRVAEAKKDLRPPEPTLEITEMSATIQLQALLDLTCRRLLEMCQEVIEGILKQHDGTEFMMQVSWGFDGTTGQSNYKMQMTFEGPPDPTSNARERIHTRPLSDSSLFVCTLIPLQIIQKGTSENEYGRIGWRNIVPQSVRFCRPISIEFAKETTELLRQKKMSIENQIKNLVPYEFMTSESKTRIRVSYECYLTIIDGKALNAITGTDSSMTCPMCKATPKTFNDLSNIGTRRFAPKTTENLKHGINPMHAYIRLFELVLHISYKMDIKKWQARSPAEKESVKSRKEYLQNELYQQMGLLVDFPASGGSGNTNDGNTARTAFRRYEEFGAILEFDIELLERFRIILITINHNYAVDTEKFEQYCSETARLYVDKYSWYYMSATLHKILVHGKEIMDNSALPLGMLSEHAGESKNKYYRKDRLHHARKNSRLANMKDTFLRALDTSDPLISSLSLSDRQKQLRRDPLPKAVIDLLLCPPLPPQTSDDPTPNLLPLELFPDDDGPDAALPSDEVLLMNEEDIRDERIAREGILSDDEMD